MKFYRVGVMGMYGWKTEFYFQDINQAKSKFTNIIMDKKLLKETLTDDECQEYNEQSRNFTPIKTFPLVKETTKIQNLRGVYWSFGYDEGSQGGTEYYTYTEEILLQEIIME